MITLLLFFIRSKSITPIREVKNITCFDNSRESEFCRTLGFCYRHYDTNKKIVDYGCVEDPDLLKISLYCSSSIKLFMCCNEEDFCNHKFESPASFVDRGGTKTIVISSIFVMIVPIVGVIILINVRKCFKAKRIKTIDVEMGEHDENRTSLVCRTEANKVNLFGKISNGRYGNVFRGIWREQTVAVKIFSPKEKDSWNSELKLMQTNFFNHSNILTLYFADKIMTEQGEQFWLLTEYHQNGSLFDYLKDHTLKVPSLLEMAFSIASGLEFMHAKLVGVNERPSIAHRDIKSKNILVKTDCTCCIGDFGLSVTSENYDGVKEREDAKSVGTLRYMAPEVLSNDPDSYYFDVLLCSDVYSLGLVLWELLCRTQVGGVCPEHRLPYFEYFGNGASKEEIKEIVCDQRIRPVLPSAEENGLVRFCEMTTMCWTHDFSARITAITVKKIISKITRRYAIF